MGNMSSWRGTKTILNGSWRVSCTKVIPLSEACLGAWSTFTASTVPQGREWRRWRERVRPCVETEWYSTICSCVKMCGQGGRHLMNTKFIDRTYLSMHVTTITYTGTVQHEQDGWAWEHPPNRRRTERVPQDCQALRCKGSKPQSSGKCNVYIICLRLINRSSTHVYGFCSAWFMLTLLSCMSHEKLV